MNRILISPVDATFSTINQNMFENKKSFQYFQLGIQAAKELQILKNNGCILFQNNTQIQEESNFFISLDEDMMMPKLGLLTGSTLIMFLGATLGNKDNTVFVYKNELQIFKTFKFIKPKFIEKFKCKF